MSLRDFAPRNHALQPPALAPDYKTSRSRSPQQPLLSLAQTLTETTGPVFGRGDVAAGDSNLLTNHAAPGHGPIGERIILHGRVLDQDARPVPHALIEIWQANAGGRYRHIIDDYLAPIDPNFGGCGRMITDAKGRFAFHTVKPGPYPWRNGPNSWRPAHVHFSVFGAGLAQRLITQCYFEGDPLIPLCPIVAAIPDAGAIDRLIARLDLDATVPLDSIAYRFDIVLRGRGASVFEDKPERG